MGGITGVDEETLQVGLKHTLKEIKFSMSSKKFQLNVKWQQRGLC